MVIAEKGIMVIASEMGISLCFRAATSLGAAHDGRNTNSQTAPRRYRRRARVSSNQKICCRMPATMARRDDRAAAGQRAKWCQRAA